MKTDEKAYRLAYRLLCALSRRLDSRTVHLRDNTGRLPRTLDEVTLAVKDGRWPGASNDERGMMNDEQGAKAL